MAMNAGDYAMYYGKLSKDLYDINKNVDIGTYNARKREALRRAQGNERKDAIADVYDSIGDLADDYSWNRLGDTYRVGLGDFVSAKAIADWYETHSFEWIQDKRQGEEFDEIQSRHHEEQMRTSPEYRAQKEKEREELARERRAHEKKAASKRMIWSIICGLLSGIVGLFVFGFIVSVLKPEHPVIFTLLAVFTFAWLVMGVSGNEKLARRAGLVLGLGAAYLCYLLKDYDVNYYASETVLGVVVGILTGVAVGRKIYMSRK
jgi:cation transport ATPase